MIDLTNAPEGATHYVYNDLTEKFQYMRNVAEHSYEWFLPGQDYWVCGDNETFIAKCKPIASWSIYNNTKPLSELSDEQAAELFNYWRNGGDVKYNNVLSGGAFEIVGVPQWANDSVYRAKQKTERELFIDLATEISSDECETERIKESIDAFIVKLFNAGFKAPKVGE